jgi:5,10-methenyltetrahydromethanopterin hydrogenase
MSIWITYECDGNINGSRCRTGTMARTENLEQVRRTMAREGFRPLTEVLDLATHYMTADEHLCKRTDHDEERRTSER